MIINKGDYNIENLSNTWGEGPWTVTESKTIQYSTNPEDWKNYFDNHAAPSMSSREIAKWKAWYDQNYGGSFSDIVSGLSSPKIADGIKGASLEENGGEERNSEGEEIWWNDVSSNPILDNRISGIVEPLFNQNNEPLTPSGFLEKPYVPEYTEDQVARLYNYLNKNGARESGANLIEASSNLGISAPLVDRIVKERFPTEDISIDLIATKENPMVKFVTSADPVKSVGLGVEVNNFSPVVFSEEMNGFSSGEGKIYTKESFPMLRFETTTARHERKGKGAKFRKKIIF